MSQDLQTKNYLIVLPLEEFRGNRSILTSKLDVNLIDLITADVLAWEFDITDKYLEDNIYNQIESIIDNEEDPELNDEDIYALTEHVHAVVNRLTHLIPDQDYQLKSNVTTHFSNLEVVGDNVYLGLERYIEDELLVPIISL